MTTTPDAVEINALLADLRIAKDAVGDKEWLSPELAGGPAVSVELLGSTGSPLSSLDSAGMGFLTPMVSFLDEPLGQLRGDPSSVSSGAGEFDRAAQDGAAVAEEYRATAGSETSEWSGQAGADYLNKGMELADGVLSIAETSLTSAKALIGAGEVVAKAVADVTALINEAVGQIVPIMSQAIASAPVTFGQSIAAAIPQCVQIAADYAGRIAGKMAALLSSGENLMKLIDGAVGVLKIVKQVLTFIGEQSQGGAPTTTVAAPRRPAAEPSDDTTEEES
ncbi:WXG100 family type VII secretion target [Actinophytocola glycyrrhizae]|uniref:WXG100 family type VII secretion target n=1 Tax=Actinophytocola glycyrrhizae TaxID=2044873 RepID=A0ABV9S0A0_9PSEU